MLTICLLSAVALVADEDRSKELPQPLHKQTELVTSPKSPEILTKSQPDSKSSQRTTPEGQGTKLKPMVLQERVRAHANIDLPQNI